MNCLAYVSNSIELPVREDKLEQLLQRARRFNAQVGVTGALVHDDGSFLQYLEGETAAIEAVMRRVYADNLHRNVTVLMSGSLAARTFPQWLMACTRVTQSDLLTLANAQWDTHLAQSAADWARDTAHDGLALLRRFWAHRSAAHLAIDDAALRHPLP